MRDARQFDLPENSRSLKVNRLKVGIIGAGNIAAGFDNPDSEAVLTHAHAILLEPRLELVGFFDVDREASFRATQKWGGASFNSAQALLDSGLDVVVIATPDESHLSYLKMVANYKLKAVVCEKPLTQDIESARDIVSIFMEKHIPLLVNFQRRFDPVVLELKKRYLSGVLGRLMGGTVWYSKGTKHNGSHAIDLLRFLFGEPTGLYANAMLVDFREDDPTVAGRLEFDSFFITLLAGNEKVFSVFEIDLFFEQGRYRFTHSGLDIEISEPQKDPVFCGYRELAIVHQGPTGLPYALTKFMNSLADYLLGGTLPENTAQDAIKTQKVCVDLIDLALQIKPNFISP
jgi:predicted dehydrogenase